MVTVALSAYHKNMCAASWALIMPSNGGAGITHGFLPMHGWIFVLPFLPSGLEPFAQKVSDCTNKKFKQNIDPTSVLLSYSAALHDAVMLYAHAATKVLSERRFKNLFNGTAVTEAVRNT